MIAQRFLNVPLMLLPGEAEKILRMLDGRAPVEALALKPAANAEERKPYGVVDGVAIIRVSGVLVHGQAFSWCGYETSYDDIAVAFTLALNDPEVTAIMLHTNSPGGEVAGCFDLAETIYQARGQKPIWAVLDEYAYSAAYALACAADRILVPRTGGTGSIGVITMHIDITKALEDFGVKVTTIQFGARKSDSYPTTPLSEQARERIQADIDTLGAMFVDLVARNRAIEPAKVRKTEAGIFLGEAGVDARLADAVMSPQDAFVALRDSVNA